MRTRLATLAVALLVAAVAPSADAGPRKPVKGAYDVLIPVPYPMEGPSAHCTEGYDDLTRSVVAMKLLGTGELKVIVSGFVGDWVLEIFDEKGRVLATGATLDLTVGAREAKWKKKRSGAEVVKIAVCNFGGTPSGTVSWSYVFSR